jgi:hypothetical protein
LLHQSEKYGKIYVAEINAKPWATMDTSMPLMVGDVLLEVDGTDVFQVMLLTLAWTNF